MTIRNRLLVDVRFRFLALRTLLFVAVLSVEQFGSKVYAEAPKDVVLVLIDEKGEKTSFTLDDLQKLPRKKVTAKGHDGKMEEFEGTPLVEVLKKGNVTLGEKLRGPLLGNYVLVEALDKYRVVFAIPELDPAYTDNVVLLADQKDGKPLPMTHAPLQVIVPHERRFSRWIRQVKTISIQRSSETANAVKK